MVGHAVLGSNSGQQCLACRPWCSPVPEVCSNLCYANTPSPIAKTFPSCRLKHHSYVVHQHLQYLCYVNMRSCLLSMQPQMAAPNTIAIDATAVPNSIRPTMTAAIGNTAKMLPLEVATLAGTAVHT